MGIKYIFGSIVKRFRYVDLLEVNVEVRDREMETYGLNEKYEALNMPSSFKE
jgi:hypothetical protein